MATLTHDTFTHEELCQQLVGNAYDAIIFADRDGTIRLWNVGAEVMFGYTAVEAIGQSLDLIVPERQRARHWEGYHRVMENGSSRYGKEMLAVPALHKDGSRISVEFTIVLIRDQTGAPAGTAAIMRDVTARRQQERDLREKLAILEAKDETPK